MAIIDTEGSSHTTAEVSRLGEHVVARRACCSIERKDRLFALLTAESKWMIMFGLIKSGRDELGYVSLELLVASDRGANNISFRMLHENGVMYRETP